MAERAELVVIGAGTIGGWASVFARTEGIGRVVVVERGLVGMGASSRAAGIVRAQGGTPATVALGRWSIDFYRGQAATYGTDSGFRELGYLILAVTAGDERAGRERVAMQQANGLDVTWLDAPAAARIAVTLSPEGHQGGSYVATDGAIDPPRNVRAYSLAMQASGVELRERTAFTALRTAPTSAGGLRVIGVDTDDGAIDADRVLLTGGPSLRSVGRLAGLRIPAGAARHTVAVLEPHPDFDVPRMPMVFDIGAGLYWRLEEGGLLFGWSDPDEVPGEARSIDLGRLRADPRAARPVRPSDDGPWAAADLGRDDRLHARSPANPRPRADAGWSPDRRPDRGVGGRPRDDVGPGRRPSGRGPGDPRQHDPRRRHQPRPRPVRPGRPEPPGGRSDRAAVPGQRGRRGVSSNRLRRSILSRPASATR